MGAPSLTLCHNLTDGIAARIRKDLDGFEAEYGGMTETSLWDMVDTAGDPAVEVGLGLAAYTVDRQSLPEHHRDSMNLLLARTGYRTFLAALDTLVRSDDGGAFENLNAYFTSVGAALHPLFGELARAGFGEQVFGTDPISNCFAPAYDVIAPTYTYHGVDGSLTDLSAEAVDASTGDLTIFASNGDALYLQSKRPFTQVIIALSAVANVTIDPLVEYWNGNAYTEVAGLVDNSVGFTKNQNLKFTLPADWVPNYQDKGETEFDTLERLYTLRIERQAVTVASPPVGTCLSLVPEPILNASGFHLGLEQPPLAIVRVTAASTIAVEVLHAPDVSRFAAPGLILRALTPFSANLTPTVSYTNQDGDDVVQAQSAWTTPAALDTVAVELDGTDTGARAILSAGFLCTTSATDGVFAVSVAELRTPAI